MFPKNFFPVTYFPANYFAPAEIIPGHSGRENDETEKDYPHLTPDLAILEKSLEVESPIELKYQEELTEQLIEEALSLDRKEVTTLQEKLKDEEEIMLMLAIVEAHEN